MKRLLFELFTLLILIAGCKNYTNPGDRIVSNELDSIDYVVISSAIDQFFFHPNSISHRFESSFDSLTGKDWTLKRNEIKMLLVIDSTVRFSEAISPYVHKNHSQIDNSDSLLTEKIIVENKSEYVVNNSNISTFETLSISRNEMSTLLDSLLQYGYEKVYEKYPDAYGIISFSKPAFDKTKEKAIIYISFYQDSSAGQGVYLWLKKQNDTWIAYDLVFLWES